MYQGFGVSLVVAVLVGFTYAVFGLASLFTPWVGPAVWSWCLRCSGE